MQAESLGGGNGSNGWGESVYITCYMPRSALTRDVLDDLGFSRSEASALKIKASILQAIGRNRPARLYAAAAY